MESKIYLNKLVKCSSAIFNLSSAFRDKEHGAKLSNDYREQILQAFDQLERNAFEQQLPLPQTQQVKYALAAFLDELVLSSAWPGRTSWMGDPLQLKYFGEHLAGEGFFKRLNDLRQNAVKNIDVLEVYYLCLQLGFEGIYRMRGLEQLLALQVDLRSQIETIRGVVDPKLSPAALPQKSMVANVGARVPYWVIGSVMFCVMFFIFLAYSFAINHQANKSLINMNASYGQLKREIAS
jgi:type VI secretion system protein ImpK